MLSFQDHEHVYSFFSNPFLLFLLSSFLIWLLSKIHYKHSSGKNLPPSPPKLPILGNLHQLSALPHRSFQSLCKKYGPFVLLHFGSNPYIIVQSADAAKEIMKTHDLIFADKPNSRVSRQMFYDLKDVMFSPYGEYWRKLRSICVLQLLNSKRVQSFSSIRKEETALLVKKIELCSPSRVNLSDFFMELTNNVICRSVFGRKFTEGEDGKKYLMLMGEISQLVGNMSIGEFIPCLSWINTVNGLYNRVNEVVKEVDDFLERVIKENLEKSVADQVKDESRGNFVDILLDIYKENATGVSIDRESIKGILLDMVVAATDSSLAALEWAMTELLKNPIVMKRLQNEVREIMNGKHDITDQDLHEMHYLKAVIKETLRYHTPLPFMARTARQDVKVMGYDIAAGTTVLINLWGIGRDPCYWNEPENFQPERFLNSNIDFKGFDFEFTPFGAGRRGCPGIAFATASVELVLANLVHKFEWKLTDGMKEEELDDAEEYGVVIHRKNPLFAVTSQCYF